ncbi:hypothetical protein AURDEDRAFT_184272 [Auricularia subglabra TFB-10046 SS5]|nr:hypothetical protein AURDEDRAFT_184272 [Auricularia subglabra TFB-10046 SS5]
MSDKEYIAVEDDNMALVSYHPPIAFEYRQGKKYSMFRSSSYHVTSMAGAYINFTFTGSFVAYYSDSNYDHNDCQISVDGREVAAANSYAPRWSSVRALYSSYLDLGPHILIITNPADGVFMGVDYFL